jgi:RNA polymerase sigma-70 factor (ECF subfamily)
MFLSRHLPVWVRTPDGCRGLSYIDVANYEDSSDLILVALAQNGDREALEMLLRRIYRPLRSYVASMASGADVDDLLQEVALSVVQHLHHLRHPAAFRAWTFRIATRQVFRHLKRASRLELRRADLSLALSAPAPEPAPEALEPVLLALIDQVSPASRAVLLLHYQQHLSLEETAGVLDIPLGTVKSRLAYGIAILRELIQEKGRL